MKSASIAVLVMLSLSAIAMTPLDVLPRSEVAIATPVSLETFFESGGCYKNDWNQCPSYGYDTSSTCPCEDVDQNCYGMKLSDNTQNLTQFPSNFRIAIGEPGYQDYNTDGLFCEWTMTYCVGTCQYNATEDKNYCPGTTSGWHVPGSSAFGWPSQCDDIYANSSPQVRGTLAISSTNGIGLSAFIDKGI